MKCCRISPESPCICKNNASRDPLIMKALIHIIMLWNGVILHSVSPVGYFDED